MFLGAYSTPTEKLTMRLPDSVELHQRARQMRSEEIARWSARFAKRVGKILRSALARSDHTTRRIRVTVLASPTAYFFSGDRSAVRCSESIR
jgi:hypothetical protein